METTMDITKYLGSAFLRVGDVKVNGPIRMVIESVTEGRFDKPDLTFDDGTRLSLNVTNTRTLARAYGTDGAGWIGKEIELYLGETEYEGKLQESILVKPISCRSRSGRRSRRVRATSAATWTTKYLLAQGTRARAAAAIGSLAPPGEQLKSKARGRAVTSPASRSSRSW
jgi:hypothetical protein